ncbi:MAG: hypothetical protein AAF764_07685 [Pseudomonadota bacterium]
MTIKRWAAPCLAVPFLLETTSAWAHAFKSGSDFYEQFQEGGGVILAYPATLLPLLAAGLLVGLWDKDGMARSFPFFAVGILLGIPLASVVGPSVALVCVVLGMIVATLAAVLNKHVAIESFAVAFATGVLTTAVALEGHGLFELPFFIHAGIVVLAIVVFVACANLVRLTMNRFENPIIAIGFRVAASWIAAALLMMLAFELRG